MTKHMKNPWFLVVLGIVLTASVFVPSLRDWMAPPTVIRNGGFEYGASGWSTTGGVLTKDTSTPLFDRVSYDWDASATTQRFQTDLFSVPPGLAGQNCLLRLFYSGGDALLDAFVEDGTAAILVEATLETASDVKQVQLNFPCPTSGTLRTGIKSTGNAASIKLDHFHLGLEDNLKTAMIVTDWKTGTCDDNWANTTVTCQFRRVGDSSEIDAYVAVTGATTAVNFQLDLPTEIPVIDTTKILNTGDQPILGIATLLDSAMAIYGGTVNYSDTDSVYVLYQNDGTASAINPINTTFITSTVPFTWANNDEINIRFSVPIVGWTSESIITNAETSAWHVDVNIGGANPAMSTASVTTYSAIVDAGLDMVLNNNSETAEIPCSGSNPPTGLTCSSGSEVVGVAFTIPKAGRYKACSGFSHLPGISVSSSSYTYFTLEEWNVTSSSKIQDGTERTGNGIQWNFASNNLTASFATSVCSDFTFSSVGKKNILLMYEHSAGGTVTGNSLTADRSGTFGQRDIHFTVESMDQQFPHPLIINSVINPREGVTKICTAKISNSGTPTVTRDDGCIDTLTDVGVGVTDVNFDSGFWSGAPNCTCTIETGFDKALCRFGAAVTTGVAAVVTEAGDTGTNTDSDFIINCVGPN
jgi:hypothetical protein